MKVFKVLKKALGNRHYFAIAVVVSVTSVVLTILLPNWKLVLEILSSNGSFWEEIKTIVNLLGAFKTNFTAWARVYLVIISVLFGINVSIIIYYIKDKRKKFGGNATAIGAGGIASGVLGAGCGACGTFAFGSLLSSVGGGWLVSFLPFGGQEIKIFSIALLVFSIYFAAKNSGKPSVCALKI
ncbi:MAG: hypothetical protein COV02_00125 [Candidatus Terrybacteria bacterium CG10_big_fil_rev_8_21_14_0_10_41_10]|uniref:Uncharacterized protein n=1 Tax=Candidatus Terrybacteria bacterium CG10_big_fil_rev_8_21_14_0_10_41_10 TaxID=1975026 RepID=A0A2M8LC08_9BACT|nr:MAG: hypothetical protein COV02_00125 [Candidatus Terrybacteria bacterium CG10_big_fil_rev_8_21_14_0_10_41_10]